MNKTKQQIALATACGWHTIQPNPIYPERLAGFFGADYSALCGIPNYLDSLDAMAQAEATLTDDERENYMDALYEITTGDTMFNDTWKYVHATAAQRAEAFLKCLNLWTEE